ncbi:hypothetical protein [Paraburkholderia caledonica]|uniref:hypothetical protein n=1 Tax=Paraburkholderia caledonica TaxID=134536 RepID=UPI0038BC0AE9
MSPAFRKALDEALKVNAEMSGFRFENSHPLEPAIIHVPDYLSAEACKDPRMARLHNTLFNQGSNIASFSHMFVLRALITQAIAHGVEHAIASMDKFFEAECNRCIDVVLLEGIRVSETTEIVPGIFICPPAAVPSSSLQSYLQFTSAPQPAPPFFMHHHFVEEKITPGAALYSIREVTPKLLDKMPDLAVPVEAPRINQVADILTIAGPSSPVVSRSYSELADGEFLKGEVGLQWGIWRNETRVFANRLVSPMELGELKSVADKYLTLDPSIKKKLSVPLHRLNEAVKHQSSVDRALDLGIALESLLLSHQPSKDQLTLQFRLRGAWLLGRDGQHRVELFNTFHQLYTYRSYAAHSGSVASSRTPEEEVQKTLRMGLELCAKAICKIIEKGGFPEWDSLVIGAKYRVEQDAVLPDKGAD